MEEIFNATLDAADAVRHGVGYGVGYVAGVLGEAASVVAETVLPTSLVAGCGIGFEDGKAFVSGARNGGSKNHQKKPTRQHQHHINSVAS